MKPGFALQTYSELFPYILTTSSGSWVHEPQVLSTITLPNGTGYTFQYNSWGELASVTLPTGGVYEYDHAGGIGSGPANSVYGEAYEVYRRVSERRVYSGPSSTTLLTRQIFTPDYLIGFQPPFKVALITKDGAGTIQANSLHAFLGVPWQSDVNTPVDYPGGQSGREILVQERDASGTGVMRSMSHNWSDVPFPAASVASGYPLYLGANGPTHLPRITHTITTLSGRISSNVFCYDQAGNKSDTYDYDFGFTGGLSTYCEGSNPAPPTTYIRHDQVLYKLDDTYTNAEVNVDCIPNCGLSEYVHLRGLPLQETVFGAGGVMESKTNYQYDVGSVSYNRGAIAGWQSPGPGPRGNATQITKWISPTSTSSTSFQYDSVGNMTQVTLPRLNTWTAEFGVGGATGSSCAGEADNSFGFVCSVINGASEKATRSYDLSTGKTTAFVTPSGHNTNYTYADPLDRLKTVVPAIGSTTVFAYDDTTRRVTISRPLVLSGGTCPTSTANRELYFDGLGRGVEDRTYNGSDWRISKTEYDALGRISKKYVPYFQLSGAAASYVHTYDLLGRITSIDTPAGGTIAYAHNPAGSNALANVTRVTDETAAVKELESDSLGRLKAVTEDPATKNYRTTYGYDGRGNLTSVNQGAQIRTFLYDGLSQLLSASNPETGQIDYNYDLNGNLANKHDSRNQFTILTYDGADRMLGKSYAAGSLTGPAVANTPKLFFLTMHHWNTVQRARFVLVF